MKRDKMEDLILAVRLHKSEGEFAKASTILYQIGNIEFNKGNYSDALLYFRDAAFYRERPSIPNNRRELQRIISSYRKAILCARRLNDKDSEVNLRIHAAHFFKEIDDIERSRDMFKQAYLLCKNERKLRFLENGALCAERLGIIGMENRFLKESAALYLKAARLSKDPNNRYRYYYLAADALQNASSPDTAVKCLIAAIETLLNNTPKLLLCDPTDALKDLFVLLGEKEPEKALELAMKLIEKIDIHRCNYYHYILYFICRFTADHGTFKDCLSKLVDFAQRKDRMYLFEAAEAAWLLEEFNKKKCLGILKDIIEIARTFHEELIEAMCYFYLSDISTTKKLQLLETGLNLFDHAIYGKSYGKYLTYDAFYHRMKSKYFILKSINADPQERLHLIEEAIEHFNQAFLLANSYQMRGYAYLFTAFKLCILGRQKEDRNLIENSLENLRNAEKILSRRPETEFLKNASQALIQALRSMDDPKTYEDYRERAETLLRKAFKNLRFVSDHPLKKLLSCEHRIEKIFIEGSLNQRLHDQQLVILKTGFDTFEKVQEQENTIRAMQKHSKRSSRKILSVLKEVKINLDEIETEISIRKFVTGEVEVAFPIAPFVFYKMHFQTGEISLEDLTEARQAITRKVDEALLAASRLSGKTYEKLKLMRDSIIGKLLTQVRRINRN